MVLGSIEREREKSRIRAVQMNYLGDLLGVIRTESIPNARIRELCGVKKWVDERIDENMRW